VFAVADGSRTVLLLASQDHKRRDEGDAGPNTGGMGAYAPVAIATAQILSEARLRVFDPVLRAMAAEDSAFRGLLYAGLMKTEDGLKVVEFNCRFGDPETQAVLPLMESSLLDLMATVAEGGSLAGHGARFADAAAVTTVVASGGYPGTYERGKVIDIPSDLEGDGLTVFHAGTTRDGDRLITSGGRVLAVTAVASTFTEAAERSREGAASVSFQGSFFRSDIGWRERSRLKG